MIRGHQIAWKAHGNAPSDRRAEQIIMSNSSELGAELKPKNPRVVVVDVARKVVEIDAADKLNSIRDVPAEEGKLVLFSWPLVAHPQTTRQKGLADVFN